MNDNPKVFLVKSLAETLFFAKKNYYSGNPTLHDETFDAMEAGMKILCPAHPVLGLVGDPGFEILGNFTLVNTREWCNRIVAEDDADFL